jgi:DNA-binding NarL/FixJ family response regulator
MTSRRRTRVAVVDRFRLVTQALNIALSPTCCPVSLSVQHLHSTSQVRDAILRRTLDVIVLGPSLGGSVDNEQLVEDLTRHGLRVVALAEQEAARMRLARAGAVATVLVSDGVAGVRDAVAAVVAGDTEPPPPAGPVLPNPRRDLLRRLDCLTRREVDVLAQLVLGRSAAEIARAHVVSELTVRSQLKSILHKLDVPCQIAAVALVKRAAWEPPLDEVA